MSTARFHFDQAGLEEQVVFSTFTEGGLTFLEEAQILKASFWDAGLGLETSSAVRLNKITIEQSGQGAELMVNTVGGGASNALPPTNAALITKVTSGGRNGRMFWPGVPEGSVGADGRWSNQFIQDDWQAAADASLAAMATQPAGILFLHVEHTVGGVVQPSTPVDALLVRPFIGTQRGRLHN